MRTKALLHTTTCADCKKEDPPEIRTAIATVSENGVPRGFCLKHLMGHKDHARIIRGLDPELEAIIQALLAKRTA